MGFRDRDYWQEDYNDPRQQWKLRDWMVITWIILINTFLFIANDLFTRPDNLITNVLSLYSWTPKAPLFYWQFLTYGFAHSGFAHLLFNMLGLFFLGRDIERRLGRAEFTRFYLTAIVFCALVYCSINYDRQFQLLGASGGVVAVVILYTLCYPHRMLYFWGVFPIPAWLIGVLYVGTDFYGAMVGRSGDGGGIAYAAHLAGAGFAICYFFMQWNFGRVFGFFTAPFRRLFGWLPLKRKPKLNIYDPKHESGSSDSSVSQREEDAKLAEQVDAILDKIAKSGEASLTRSERETLKKASKKYRKKYQ